MVENDFRDLMSNALKFRGDFIDAYFNGGVNLIGIHSTKNGLATNSLRRGLKCRPSMHRVIRRELGVHFERLLPTRQDLTRKRINPLFDRFARAMADLEEGTPGLVLLKEEVPRERRYGEETLFYSHRYVPVRRGMENSIDVLIPGGYILGVVVLEGDEQEVITKAMEKKFGSWAFWQYQRERGKITDRRFQDTLSRGGEFSEYHAGLLLLSKSAKYFFR